MGRRRSNLATLRDMGALSLVTLLLGAARELLIARDLQASGDADMFFRGLVAVATVRACALAVYRARWIPADAAISTEGGAVWRPDLTVRATDPPTELPLTMMPARCDDHVFMEGGGMTAFKIHLLLDGKPLDLVVRMSDAGAAATYAFVRDSCDK